MSFRIEHRLGISLPAPVVWAVLADLEAWPQWNPVYPKTRGRLGIGERLELTERADGQDRHLTARVVDWVPNEQILWNLSGVGGLSTRLRFIELESLSRTGCVLANGEIFKGVLADVAHGGRRRALSHAYAEMNEAVKVRAEARWAKMSAAERDAAVKESPEPAPPPAPLPKIDLPRPMTGYFKQRK